MPQLTYLRYPGSIIQIDREIDWDVTLRIQAKWMKWRISKHNM